MKIRGRLGPGRGSGMSPGPVAAGTGPSGLVAACPANAVEATSGHAIVRVSPDGTAITTARPGASSRIVPRSTVPSRSATVS